MCRKQNDLVEYIQHSGTSICCIFLMQINKFVDLNWYKIMKKIAYYLSSKMWRCKRFQVLIESLLIELIVVFCSNLFGVSKLQNVRVTQCVPWNDARRKQATIQTLTHIGWVSLVKSQSQYFSTTVLVFFFFCHNKYISRVNIYYQYNVI